jgi:hypothetical protein
VQARVTFPQAEIGVDPKAIRDYALAAEDLGYDHLLAYDRVLGADPAYREGWRGYTHETMFHEPLTLFGSIPPGASQTGPVLPPQSYKLYEEMKSRTLVRGNLSRDEGGS